MSTPSADCAVHELLRAHAEADGERPFLVFEGEREGIELSYGQMYGSARACAAELAARGIGPGDRIHLDLLNCPQFLVVLFAASMLGAEIVPTNPAATEEELAFLLGHCGAALTIVEPQRRATVEAAAAAGRLDGLEVLTREQVPVAVEPASPDRPGAPPRAGGERLAILYTSGTTGRPKGVCVTHANYLHVGRVMAASLELSAEDRWLVVLPLFHANAQYYCLMSALTVGSSIVLAERFSASRWAAQARRHRATVASLFAAPIRMILANQSGAAEAANDLRVTIFAQRIDARRLRAFEERFGCGLLQIYGMTETIAPPLMNPLRGQRRNETVGHPVATEVALRDADGRASAEVGELWVRGRPGTTLTPGYLDDEAATRAAIRGEWLRTGDVMRKVGEGWYAFEDRVKDMIKTAGENVAAAEVERALDLHPDVFESAVIGLPDPVRDEVVGAFVVFRDGAEVSERQLIEWCEGRIAKFKVPASVTAVAALPRTAVGKVQKERLRAALPSSH